MRHLENMQREKLSHREEPPMMTHYFWITFFFLPQDILRTDKIDDQTSKIPLILKKEGGYTSMCLLCVCMCIYNINYVLCIDLLQINLILVLINLNLLNE